MHPAQVAELVAAIVLGALGTWVIALGPRRRLHQAFAVLVFVMALASAGRAFIPAGSDGTTMADRAFLHAYLALPFVTLGFALAFHRAHVHEADPSTPHAHRMATWSLVVAAAVVQVAYWIDRGWVEETAIYTLVLVVPTAVNAIVALFMSRECRKAAPGWEREALRLLALAFTLHPAYLATFQFILQAANGPGTPTEWLMIGISVSAVVLCVVTAFILSSGLPGAQGHVHGGRAGMVLLGAAFTSALLTNLLFQVQPPSLGPIFLTAFGSAWRLLFAATVAYAIVTFCLFGLDPRFRVLVREAAFVGGVGLTFWVVEQVLQLAVQPRFEVATWLRIMVSFGIAGGVALAMAPLRGWFSRLAQRLVPPPDESEASRRRRVEIYRAAYVTAHQDGVITTGERRALEQLASSLGLRHAEVKLAEGARRLGRRAA